MKNFKNICAILILCTISTVHAKRTGAAQAPITQPTQPAIAPITPSRPSNPLAITSAADQANKAINIELAKIEKSQDAIKDSASSVLNDTTISIADKDRFMNKVKAAYDVMNESSAEGYTELINKLRQLKE